MKRDSALRCSEREGRQAGFTLLELLIAMACVGLVAGGIALSISTCIKVWNRAGESADLNQEARALLDMISRDLRGVYFGLDGQTGYLIEKGSEAVAEGGSAEVIELATHGGALERFCLLPEEVWKEWELADRPPISDYLAVRYQWLKETSDQVGGLYRMVSPVPFPAAEEDEEEASFLSQELVSTAISELQFDYYDGKEEEWVDSWDSTDAALAGHPLRAIWVRMTLKDARGRGHEFETMVPIPTA